METVQPNLSVPLQRRWKEMLKTSKMHKLDAITPLPEESTDNTPSKHVQMYLNQDMTSFTCIEGTKERIEKISSISRVYSEQTDSQSFTIEWNTTSATMIFKATSVTLAQDWIHGLKALINNQHLMQKGDERRNEWLRDRFQALSSTDHHELKYNDVLKLVLNAQENSVSPAVFKQKLKEYLKSKKLKYKEDDGFSRLQHFVEFYKHIFDRKEMVNLFRRIASDGAFIFASDLHYFLTEDQHQQNVTQEQCKEIIVTNEVTQVGKENVQLNIDGFTHFMLSKQQRLFNPEHDVVYQDMSQPLPHYYIASSHNTYLYSGSQLSGISSAQAYSDVLEKGCRCVELDCWDGDDEEPIVYHGHTLTTKILFKDIIKAINISAFMTSPYPVILSLENHCSLDVQKKMASYLVEILGDKMYTLPVDKNRSDFPSPEFFKHKILIRGKVGSIGDEEDSNDNKSKSSKPKVEKKEKGTKKEIKEERDSKEAMGQDVNMAKELPDSSSQTRERRVSLTAKKKIAEELSDLINYVSNAKFTSFEESDKSGKYWQSSSFVEGEMEYHTDKNPESFIRFNRRQLSRIYPGGLRIDSSNYSPIKPWSVGSQIVALNHQTNDECMALYYGKFRQNGRAGYIIKPQFLRDPSIKFNPNVTKPRTGSKVLKMTIISGQQLPDQPNASWSVIKDEPDPYVYVQIHGIPADEFTFTTKAFYDNSFNPIWDQSFETNVLVPELAMVMFSVYDKDVGFDDFIGQAVLPFESMQQGYRHLSLIDKEGVVLPCASIFIHVICEDLKQDGPASK